MSSVSVVVPSYNYATISRVACTALSQPGVEVEVLIIDDCSQDDTPSVATGSPETTPESRSAATRRTSVTSRRTTKDCNGRRVLLRCALRRRSAHRRCAVPSGGGDGRSTGVGLVYGRSLYFVSNDELPTRDQVSRVDRWDGSDWIAQRCKTATSCISSPEVVVRTSLQTQIGGYRDHLPHPADVEMWLRFAANGDVAYLGRVDQALYRKHPNSMMRTTFADPLIDLQQRKAAFDAVFDSYQFRDAASCAPRPPRSPARHCGERAGRSIAGSWSRFASTTSKPLRSRRTRPRRSSARASASAGGVGSGCGVVSSCSRSSSVRWC